MTDINVGISKIYQFIKNDIYQMDLDGNGEINEAEAKYFLKDIMNKGNISLDDGDNPNDIISAFWKKINTNRAGKSIVKLDNNEIDSMNQKIEIYEKFENYFDNNIITKLSSNKYITDSESREKWIKSVKESLLNSVDQFITKGGKPEQLESFLNGQLDNKYYADPTRKNVAQLAMNKTTANIYAQKYIQEQLGDIGATFSDLQKLIDDLVTKEIGDGDMTDEVISKTKAVVDDYLAQASGNYEFSDKEKKQALTEYQGYTLNNQLTEVLKGVEKEEGYAENKELYDGTVKSYVEKMLSETNKGGYNDALKLKYTDIINSAEFKEVKDKIAEIVDLKTLPDDFWSGLPENIKVFTGGTGSYSVPNSYTTPNGVEVESSRITFKVSSNSVLSVASDGTVTVKGAAKESVNSATVTVFVDGMEAGSRKVTVKTENLKGSDLQVNSSDIYFDDIKGYKDNEKLQVINRSGYGVSAGELKSQVKTKLDTEFKPELELAMKKLAKNLGISYSDIESLVGKVYEDAFETAFNSKVDGHGTKFLGSSARAWVYTKDIITETINVFNTNIQKEFDKQQRYNV